MANNLWHKEIIYGKAELSLLKQLLPFSNDRQLVWNCYIKPDDIDKVNLWPNKIK